MNDDEAVDVLSVPIQLLFLMSLTSLSSLHSVFGVWVLPEVFASLLGLQWIHEAFGRNSHIFCGDDARAALGIWTLSCEPLKCSVLCLVFLCCLGLSVDTRSRVSLRSFWHVKVEFRAPSTRQSCSVSSPITRNWTCLAYSLHFNVLL